MMGFVLCISIVLLIAFAITTLINKRPSDVAVADKTANAYSNPLGSLSKKQKSYFIQGKTIFHGLSNDTRSLEQKGIGPKFNTSVCADCHVNDGRGNPDTTGSIAVKLYNAKSKDHGDPIYSRQLQTNAINPDDLEASIYKTHFELYKGQLDDTTIAQFRITPSVFGTGLIEAIPDSFFYEKADPQDMNKDGISGRVSLIRDIDGNTAIGRFGWNATINSVSDQTLLAAFEEHGLTNSKFTDHSGNNDMSENQENVLTFYTRALAPPAKRKLNPRSNKGKQIFMSIGCASCHSSNIKLSKTDIVKKDTVIDPYSDFLLHNMGSELADANKTDTHDADEFRTAPLWGIGLVKQVNGGLFLMHDGRARSFDQAIKLHAGEAMQSSLAYKSLTSTDKKAIIAYLESL